MKYILSFLLMASALMSLTALEGDYFDPNPQIDFDQFLKNANDVNAIRATRRVSEARFIQLCNDASVIVLDARSRDMYAKLHVKGAINLPFPDITINSLNQTLPDKKQTIVIYCNNNFNNAPVAFESKRAPASLNISTFISLHTYGYKNVFELGPLLDIKNTKIDFVGVKE